jgi:hypothetical protein
MVVVVVLLFIIMVAEDPMRSRTYLRTPHVRCCTTI